jgi:fucose permease
MEVATVKIRGPLLLICMIFFVLGFFTWVNAMLIPYFKVACELTNFESYLVTFAFYISYLVIALPASLLLNKVGFKKGMTTAFFLMATGAFTFIPAAYTRSYLVFLLGLFIIGIGLAILQTAVNPYVTLLGAKERAAQRISIMGICNKTAGIIAPLLIMGLSGNAVLPLLYGRLADVNGHQQAYWVLLPCYIFLAFYAFYGHNIKKWRSLWN